jgi:tetrahydromethanopterin S-methyltransferase subunit F
MLSKYMTNKGKMLNSITDRNNLFVRNKQLQALDLNSTKMNQRN